MVEIELRRHAETHDRRLRLDVPADYEAAYSSDDRHFRFRRAAFVRVGDRVVVARHIGGQFRPRVRRGETGIVVACAHGGNSRCTLRTGIAN